MDSANRSNIGAVLDGMIGDRTAKAVVTTIYKSEDGILKCMGLTVPTDGTLDYAPGCIFQHVDGEVIASGTVKSGTATTLVDRILTSTYNRDDELIGLYVADTDKLIYGVISDYVQATGSITVSDWLNYSGVAVAATKIPVHKDNYHIFSAVSANVLYVNVGNNIIGCKFERVLIAGIDEDTFIDNEDAPSRVIWKDVDLNALRNFSGGFLYENDFMGPVDVTTADGWTQTVVTAGALTAEADVPGGVLFLDSTANATADDGIEAQLLNCSVLPAAGQKIYFEARVKMVDTGIDQYFIGLCGVLNAIMASGVIDDTVGKVGFFRDSGTSPADDRLTTITARGNAEHEGADKVVIADDTYIKLGFVIDGLTSISFYADGVLVDTVPVAQTANIPNVGLSLSFVSKIEDAATDSELRIDWVRVAQVGVRDA
jgi:hypothetical protein